MDRKRLNISFLWLLVVAALGFVLRLFPLTDPGINYKNVLHAHSHVAFLGWVFTALFSLITISFLKTETVKNKRIHQQFIISQIAVAGMLISFIYQGYGPVSIFFSALHMFVSVWFAVYVIRCCKPSLHEITPLSVKFLFAALAFMMLSSFGPLLLPVFSKVYGAGSQQYSNAIYFYLHFQYNGWFIFALLALLFKKLEENEIKFSLSTGTFLFRSLLVSCVLSFFLSVLWTNPNKVIWFAAGLGAFIQLASLTALYLLYTKLRSSVKGVVKYISMGVMIAFTIKVILQFLSVFPVFVEMTTLVRHFIIAYLHLVLLGVVTLSIIAFYIEKGFLDTTKILTKTGLIFFVSGFISSELLAVLQGLANYFNTSIPHYYYSQTIAAVLILFGVGFTYSGRTRFIGVNMQRLYINSSIINNSKLEA